MIAGVAINFYSLFLRRLAGFRPGGRLTFLHAQESQQRKRCCAGLGALELTSRLRRYVQTATASQTGGALRYLTAVP